MKIPKPTPAAKMPPKPAMPAMPRNPIANLKNYAHPPKK